YHCIHLSDASPWDRGLDTVIIKSITGLKIHDQIGNVHGQHNGELCVAPTGDPGPQTICVEAIDLAGHRTDSCFTYSTSYVNDLTSQLRFEMFPNPAEGLITITIADGHPVQVNILDVLGRTVAHFNVLSRSDYDINELPV